MNPLTLIGYLLLFIAFLLAGAETMAHVVRDVDGFYLSARDLWHTFWPGSLVQFRLYIEQNISREFWDSVVLTVMALPGWSIPGFPGFALVWFFRTSTVSSDEVREIEESMLLYDRLSQAANEEGYNDDEDDMQPVHFNPMEDGGYEEEDLHRPGEDGQYLNDWDGIEDALERAKAEGLLDLTADEMLSPDRVGGISPEDDDETETGKPPKKDPA